MTNTLLTLNEIMKVAGVPPEDWLNRLVPLLSEGALSAYTSNVSEEARENYPALKEALLTALGMSKEACEREFWSMQSKLGESLIDKITELKAMMDLILEKCVTAQEASNAVVAGKFPCIQ